MAEFLYRAIAENGKERKGNLIAEDELGAAMKLKSMNLMPLEIKSATALTKGIDINFGSKVKPRDLSIFCRQFVSMLKAGISIIDALDMLAQQTESKNMAKAIRAVQHDIEKGDSLSDSMGKHPKVFPEIMVNMVTAGEASGKLETTFEHMAVHFEKDAKIRALMKKAAMYPIIVAIVALVVVVVLLVMVIPGYASMFEEMDMEMPAITLLVMHMSDFIKNKWPVLILVIAAAFVVIFRFKQTEKGKIFFGNISRKAPVLGKLNIKTESSVFARTLGTLLYSGLPLVDAVGIVADTMTNAVFQNALKEAREVVVKGVPLSEPLKNCGLFPPMVSHMVRIGEETGDVEGMLDRLSVYYDEEVEMATQTVMAALEPMIIIVMAVIVVFLIAAVMSPMLAMYGGLDNL